MKKLCVLVILLAFFCGCASNPVEDATPSTTIKETTDVTTPPEEDGGGMSITDLMAFGAPTAYSVEYEIETIVEIEASAPGGGVDYREEPASMTEKYYVNGEKTMIEGSTSSEALTTHIRVYEIPEGSYLCWEDAGEWMCFGSEKTEEEDDYASYYEYLNLIDENPALVTYTGTETVAGVSTICYSYGVGVESWKICIHPQAYIPLLIEAEDMSMKATSFSLGAPDDSVFELPAEPMDL